MFDIFLIALFLSSTDSVDKGIDLIAIKAASDRDEAVSEAMKYALDYDIDEGAQKIKRGEYVQSKEEAYTDCKVPTGDLAHRLEFSRFRLD